MNSFPLAHVWIQARDSDSNRGICIAGGKILGMHAFVLGYRSPTLAIDMLPPFALSVLGFSPFMSTDIDYSTRSVSITVCNFWYRIKVWRKAPKEGGWFGLGSSFPEGHRGNSCTESFMATEVEVCERRGLWGWSEVAPERFEDASLEFAGGHFLDRGEKED